MNNKYNFISIFSGAMGLDIGLEKSGWECVLAADIDKTACATIKANRPNLPLVDDDIRKFSAADLLAKANVKKEDIFAIVGGPPCQAFSSAGKRLGLDDSRGNVFLKYLEFINDIKPPYAVIENVRGILSMPVINLPKTIYPVTIPKELLASKHGLMLLLLEQLEEMGYGVSFTLYNTANYGVPQTRERVVIFCARGTNRIPLMPPKYFPNKKPQWKTLKHAIGKLRSSKMRFVPFPESRLQYYRMLKEGQNWRDLPKEVQALAMGKSFYLGGGKTGFFRRLSWEKPSPTLVTSPTMPATDLCHPIELRPLSVEEYARIQQFPAAWKFVGRIPDLYRQIGNAVPVGFGKAIGEQIIKFHCNHERNTASATMNITISTTYSRYRNTDHLYFEKLLQDFRKQLYFFEKVKRSYGQNTSSCNIIKRKKIK